MLFRSTITKETEIEYIITAINNTGNQGKIQLEGKFHIESSDVQTGDFDYKFSKEDISKYSIKQNENGFTFKFNSSNPSIKFKLIPISFFNPYKAFLVVDANSAGYGNVSVELIVDPEFEIVQADNISDYGPQLNIDPASLEPLESTKLKQIEEVLKQSERFFIKIGRAHV